jgi:dihydroflavonol-4-reductase
MTSNSLAYSESVFTASNKFGTIWVASLYAGITTEMLLSTCSSPEEGATRCVNGSAVKILVTGATGFLGTHVAEALAGEGHALHIMHRRTSDTSRVKRYAARLIVSDVTDPVESVKAAQGMDAVVHLAADLSHWQGHRDRIMRTNITGTRVMAEAAKTAGVPRFLHISSVAAVGYSPDGTPIDESAENNFVPLRLLYHESKRLAEEEALDAARYGVAVVIVNPGVLYGPRSLAHTFGHTMLELAGGRIPGHPTGGISVTDVRDAAIGIVAALRAGKSMQRYLLAGHNLSYEDVFKRQAQAVGVTYRGRPLSQTFLRLAATAFEFQSRFNGREPRLTRDNARIGHLRMYYDSGRAQRELGYTIRPLEETFAAMIDAYRALGALPARI